MTYHKSGQSARLDPTVDTIQDTTNLLLDLDIEAYILPLKDRSLLLNRTRYLLKWGRSTVSHPAHNRWLFDVAAEITLVSSLEQKNFSLQLLRRDVFRGQEVREGKEDSQCDDNPEVSVNVSREHQSGKFYLPPQVTGYVVKAESNVISPRDNVRARNSSDDCTDVIEISDLRILCAARNECTTIEIATMILVDHQALKSISNWVDVVNPTEPGMHIADRNHEAGVCHQCENQDRRGKERLNEASRGCSNRPEYHRQGYGNRERE